MTLPLLELMRRRMRTLVRLVERSKRAVVYTDSADELGEISEVTLHPVGVGADLERFRAKARAYLSAHEDHVALQKLRRHRQLSATNLDELERMLVDAGGGPDDIDRARESADGLGGGGPDRQHSAQRRLTTRPCSAPWSMAPSRTVATPPHRSSPATVRPYSIA